MQFAIQMRVPSSEKNGSDGNTIITLYDASGAENILFKTTGV